MTSQPRPGKAPDLAVDVTIATADGGPLPAAMALPPGTDGGPAEHGQNGPAVIVLHELLGLNTDIRRICGRFAGSGYVALAPDFMHPDGAERTLRNVCPVVASYGGRDRVFGGHGARLESALTALDVPHDVQTYPGAGHSFMNRHDGPLGWAARLSPLHAGYHGPSAEDAWARMLDFLGHHLAPNAQGRVSD